MNRLGDVSPRHRLLGALFALVAVAAAAVVAAAAIQPRADNPHGKFKENCQLCHTAKSWKAVKIGPGFDHGKFGFPLAGAHKTASCMGCHTSLDFAQSRTLCASCHQDPHRSEMGTDCARCHGARSFQDRGPMVRAHQLTRFPLTASHATVECESCHRPAAQGQLQFVATSAECYSCHRANYEVAPNHKRDNFSTECRMCHTPVAWNQVKAFDHTAAGFPLTGAHSTASRACDDCHHGSFSNTSAACYSCHLNSTPGYANTGPGSPVHTPTYFPYAQCATCHAVAAATHTSWAGGTYAHTQMQFTGGHAGRACNDCHNGNYTSVAYSCYGCHQAPIGASPGYATATNPPHTPAYFPTSNSNCTGCHNTVAWSPSLWPANHSTTTFAAYYNGAHPAAACTQCHNASTWTTQATGNNCYGCHSADYAAAIPPHDPISYPQAGCTCHTTTTWTGATAFDHASVGFSMTGQHSLAARACADCHNIIGYTPNATDKDCITCHATDYGSNGVLIHTSPHFPSTTTQCITCHAAANTNHVTWQGGLFASHTAVTTNFSITNANHGGFQCADCHVTATTNLKEWTCAASCHTSSRFLQHSNKTCGGLTFNTVKATGNMKACYTCHPSGTTSSPC